MMYIFCLIWSCGAQLVGDSRVKYDAFIKKLAREALPDGLIYDHFFDLTTHRWEKWQSKVQLIITYIYIHTHTYIEYDIYSIIQLL